MRQAEAKFGQFNYDHGPLQDFEGNYLDNKVPSTFELKKLVLRKKVPVEVDAVYSGQWDPINECREGRGTQIWKGGSKYVGWWHKGKANGRGRFILADGDVYEGEWVDDRAHGYGVYWYVDGSTYEGYWKSDKQEGRGKETWPDKSFYIGEFMGGKKHGRGIFTWADGAYYDG